MNDEVQVIKSEVAPVVDQAASMVVNSAESYVRASDFLKRVKQAQGRVTAFFAPMKQKAYEAHKAITAQESETLKPLQQAEETVNSLMANYYREQKRIELAEQQKAQAAADEAARKERERLERALNQGSLCMFYSFYTFGISAITNRTRLYIVNTPKKNIAPKTTRQPTPRS